MSPTRRSPEIQPFLDFCDDCPEEWLGFGSVEEEILRGAGLRLHKPDYRLTCDNVAYEMPIATGYEKKIKKKYSKRPDAIQTTPCSPRPCSPQICRNSPAPTVMCVGGAGSCTSTTHHYWSKKCPLRIAELAQPKKRQCIENIKDNAHRLPPVMLERLRQRVNDDRPLAEITDAINCFKIRRPTARRRRPKSTMEWQTICNSIKKENLKRMEIRDLCAVFGHGLVTKLAIPMVISLNSELEMLSEIVESDISQVMRCNKLTCDTNATDCKRIRKEIADRVTAWIATVLEESECRLVDEDVKENKKRALKRTRCAGGDNVVTVIENQHILSLATSRAEMEEEIGPVLDFVDDLVNTVMGSVPTEDDTDSYTEAMGSVSDVGGTNKSKYDTADSDEDPENTAKLDSENIKPLSSANDFYSKTPPIDKETVEDDIENLNANNESADGLDESDTDGAEVDTNDDIGSAPDLTEHTDADINAETDEVKEYKNFGAEVTSSAFVDNVVEEEGQPNGINNPTDDNKIVGLLHKENSVDDKNKAVKFTNVDMVIEGDVPKPNESTITFTKLLEFTYVPAIKRSVYDSYPLDSELGPPNENLLSQADESWPDDITTPGLTINSAITQSITSLGKIVESDQEFSEEYGGDKKHSTEEYLLITDLNSFGGSNNNFNYVKHKKLNLQTIKSDSNKLDDKSNNNENITIFIPDKNESKYDENKSDKEPKPRYDSDTLRDEYNKKNNNMMVLVDVSSREIVKEKDNTTHQKDLNGFEKCKGDHKDVDKEKPPTMESQQHHIFDKFEYRVNLETAPAWAHIASEHVCNCVIDVNGPKNDTKELEIKKWCKDLDSAYEGLEQWSLWIKAACKEVIELKQKFQETKKPCAHHYCQKRAKEWSRLKRDIDKDTILWTKLYQRAHRTLKAYTEKQKQKIIPTSISIMEDSSNGTQELISVYDYVDSLQFRTYQLINSTEQWYACTCRNTTKKYGAIDT